MAVASVVLNIKANTDRALNDFKRFSAQLDNKFLVSGLKLDVVRSALGQINREFQKAIGEQGLQAGQSLIAAQNQAASILNVFKSIGPEASKALTDQFSTAFSRIAVQAGGTSDDIKKALSATPFISTNLSKEVRDSLNAAIMGVQVDMRRAGLGEDFGGVVRQFLAGELSAGQMIGSGNALQTQLGGELLRKTGNIAVMTNAQERSEAIFAVVSDPKFRKALSDSAKEAYGFRATIEDLNTRLFNPKEGVFGVLREVTMGIGDKTNIFRETGVLVESVFGRQGLFVNFFRQIGKIFGIEDPLKVIVIGIRFVTRQFDRLNAFIQSPEIQGIAKRLREAFDLVKDFAKSVYDAVTGGFNNSADIQASIRGIGEQIRKFIENVGKNIKDANVNEQGAFFLSTFTTIVGEVAQTLGTTIKEAILITFSGKGAAVLGGAIKVLYEGLSKFFAGLFGGNQAAGGALGGAAMAALGILFVRRIRGALESILAPIQALGRGGGGAGGFINRLLGGGRGGGGGGGVGIGFQAQVIARMDAIIRILAGGGATDIDYGGERSPIDGGPRRGGRGGGGGGGPRIRPRTQYSAGIGPLTRGSAEAWAFDGDDFQPYMDPDRTDARSKSLRQRFNSRYGTGGGRALMARRFRGFGRGALIAGGIGLGAAALFGGGSAQAAEMGEGQGVGAGEAFGRVGMGAAEGALTGAMFGPWGAAIGGAIGGGVALFDKGVRDAIGKSITKFGGDSLKWLESLRRGFIDNTMKAFEGIKTFTSNIDWGNLILDVIFPGRGLARSIAEASGVQASGQNKNGIFGQVKDALASFFGIREVGGPVIRGTSYIVGERGPEIFTPGQNGSISANRELATLGSRGASGGGVSANFNIAINVNGNVGAGDVEALRAPVLRIVEEAWASATQGTVSRGVM